MFLLKADINPLRIQLAFRLLFEGVKLKLIKIKLSLKNRPKHVIEMFPFRIIKCLRTRENVSHSAVHLSIAEPRF